MLTREGAHTYTHARNTHTHTHTSRAPPQAFGEDYAPYVRWFVWGLMFSLFGIIAIGDMLEKWEVSAPAGWPCVGAAVCACTCTRARACVCADS